MFPLSFRCALALLVGEIIAFQWPLFSSIWSILTVLCIWLFLVIYGWCGRISILGIFFSVGLLVAWRAEACLGKWENLAFRSIEGKAPSFTFRVEGESVIRQYEKGEKLEFPSHLGPLPITIIIPMENKKKDEIANVVQPSPFPKFGEMWRIRGRLSHVRKNKCPFSRRPFRVASIKDITFLSSPPPTCHHLRYSKLQNLLAERLSRGLSGSPEMAALLRAIVLGRRTDLSPAQREIFVRAGTIHVFAISGLHVMLIALILSNIACLFRIPLMFRGAVVLPILMAYVFLTGAHASAVRAVLMAGIYAIMYLTGRRANILSAWSITVLLVFSTTPEIIFDIGCLFSFSVMLGIALWLVNRPPRCHMGRLPTTWEKERATMAVSLAAWAAGIPIGVAVFGRFTLGGLLANLIVLKLAGLSVAFGFAGILLSFVPLIPLEIVFNNLAAFTTWLMTFASALVAAIPCSTLELRPWTIFQCINWYILCFLCYFLYFRYRATHIKIL